MMNTLPARCLPVARPHTREEPQLYIYPQRRDVIAISEGRFAIQRRARPPPRRFLLFSTGRGAVRRAVLNGSAALSRPRYHMLQAVVYVPN